MLVLVVIMIPLKVLLLTWAVVNIFLPSVRSQCHTTPRVQQKPADKTTYETDEIDLKEILISVLKYAVIIQDEFWGSFGTNLTLTYPQDGSCSILGVGFPLSEVTSSMIWGNPITQIPILVNVLVISPDRIYIPSQNTTVLLTLDQFKKVCDKLGIIVNMKAKGAPQLTIHKDPSGELILQNFNVNSLNVCSMSTLGTNLNHDIENTLQILQDTWETLTQIITFYGQNALLQELGTCLNTKNLSIQLFLNTKQTSFLYCIKSLSNELQLQTKNRRSANLLSFLIGDGRQLNEIEQTLKESIEHYNNNFQKLKVFDDKIVDTFQTMSKEITNLANLEDKIEDKIAQLKRFTKMNDIKMQYLLVKLQHASAIHRLLTESRLLDNLAILERALFSANQCTIRSCEINISAELIGSKVLIHREILELKPVMKYLISCMAITTTTVPSLHNQLAERTQSGDYLIGTKLYNNHQLSNTSVVNENARLITVAEKLLGAFHHYQSEGINMIQCLEELQFTLNDKELHCKPLTEYTLPEEFVLKANEEELRSQKLVEARQRIAIGWIREYEFSNIDLLPEEKEPSLTILHPTIERFFYEETGQLNIQKTSLMGTGMFLLTAIIIGFCCWKVTCFREGTFSIIKRIHSALYEMCTTEQFRLKKENAHLKKKINKSFTELEDVEDLIRKKKIIHNKLPEARGEQTSPPPSAPHSATPTALPSAPPSEVNEKNLGKSKVHMSRTKVEFHNEDRYSGNPRKPKDGNIPKNGNIM